MRRWKKKGCIYGWKVIQWMWSWKNVVQHKWQVVE
jgi:hypothetical protein